MDWLPLDINNQFMVPYVLKREKLVSDDTYLFSPKAAHEFWNLIQMPRFSYYPDIPMRNGIMVDLSLQEKHIRRSIYTMTNLAFEMGGFTKIMGVIFGFIFSWLVAWPMEKELTSRMFKTYGHKTSFTGESGKDTNQSQQLSEKAVESLQSR